MLSLIIVVNGKRKYYNINPRNNDSSSFTWSEDSDEYSCLNLSPKIQSNRRCKHPSCRWRPIWQLFTNDPMPSEFCEEMAVESVNLNAVD